MVRPVPCGVRRSASLCEEPSAQQAATDIPRRGGVVGAPEASGSDSLACGKGHGGGHALHAAAVHGKHGRHQDVHCTEE